MISMKVLIVQPHMNLYGGAELVIVKLARYLKEHGHEPAVLTLFCSDEIRKELDGIRIIEPDKRTDKPENFISTYFSLKKILKKHANDFDVINYHNFPAETSSISGKPSIWLCNEPLTMYFSNALSAKIISSLSLMFDKSVVRKNISRCVVADDFNSDRFEKLYGIKPEIIYYGIDHAFFSEGNASFARQKFNISENDFTILHVGMITELKNQMESIRTLEAVSGEIPNAKLVLAGKGGDEYEKNLMKYADEHGLKEKIIFTGHVRRDVVRNLYAAANVALFPIKSQGGWLSPFEALCARVPVIVSEEMTSSDIIRKNDLGIVTKDFPSAVMEIFRNSGSLKDHSERNSNWVKDNLSWDNFSIKMTGIMEKFISENK